MGNNLHGNKNEYNLVEYINNKKVNQFNQNIKTFIYDIAYEKETDINDNTIIYSEIETNNKVKQDFYLRFNDVEVGVSVKMGSSNSVHQEKIEDFLQTLDNISKLSINEKDAFRHFAWGDGTTDGSGKISSRVNANKYMRENTIEKNLIEEYFSKNKKELLAHVLFLGRQDSRVDYIYHGTVDQGSWLSKNEIINFNLENNELSDKNIKLGNLTFQVWNRSLKGSKDERRGQIQFKWSSMESDLNMIKQEKFNKFFLGDDCEYNFTRELNKNKSTHFWYYIMNKLNITNNDDLYAVTVKGKKHSTLTGKKEFCKSDIFLIERKMEKQYLIDRQYLLLENQIPNNFKIIQNSGISIKNRASNRYTICKLSINSFVKIFGNIYIGIGILLYVDDSSKNLEILKHFNITYKNLISEIEKETELNIEDISFNNIKEISKNHIKYKIDNSTEIKDKLFRGKGVFDDPFYINMIYKNGTLTDQCIIPYTLTTGSGRSKGKYSIILKPVR